MLSISRSSRPRSLRFFLCPPSGLPPRHQSPAAAREGRQRRCQGQPREFDCVNSALCRYETSRRPRAARVRLPMATSAVTTSAAAGASVSAAPFKCITITDQVQFEPSIRLDRPASQKSGGIQTAFSRPGARVLRCRPGLIVLAQVIRAKADGFSS